MARCKYCEQLMDWGKLPNGKFIALVPINDQRAEMLEKTHQDENGNMRSLHSTTGCYGRPFVKIEKLPFPISPEKL